MSDFQNNDPLIIGGVELHSRLFIGTGKYSNDALIPDVCVKRSQQELSTERIGVIWGNKVLLIFSS